MRSLIRLEILRAFPQVETGAREQMEFPFDRANTPSHGLPNHRLAARNISHTLRTARLAIGRRVDHSETPANRNVAAIA